MEDHAMSLIRNGYAVSTRGGFSGALFSALLALALFDPGAATAQEGKQIKLTEKHIQGFMAASKDMAKLYDGADPDKPDPKVEAQAGAIAKKSGFASLAEYEDASMNIAMIMYGIDQRLLIGARAKMQFPIHPHMLRHGCGYAIANAGHDTRALQAWLGHKNIQHTVRYTELTPTRFKDFWDD
jgi:hypothetical protein